MVEVNSFNNGFEMCFNSNALVVYRRARRRRRRRRAKGNKTRNKKKNENEIRTQKLCLHYIFILFLLLNWKTTICKPPPLRLPPRQCSNDTSNAFSHGCILHPPFCFRFTFSKCYYILLLGDKLISFEQKTMQSFLGDN